MMVYSSLQFDVRGMNYSSIDKAQQFASMIEDDDEFELITYPELSLLTYRYVPAEPALLSILHYRSINELLNRLTKAIQNHSVRLLISWTRFEVNKYPDDVLTVFCSLTTVNIPTAEQKAIALD